MKAQLFSRRKKVRKAVTKKMAIDAAKDVTNSQNVAVKKRRVPGPLINYIEKNMKVKYKKRPKLYTYKPKKGHRFRSKKECGGWDGVSVTSYDTKNGKINDTVIVLPESHFKDKRLKENVLTHELAETLVGQHLIKPGKPRTSSQVSNFEHGVFAMAYEKKNCDKNRMTRRQISNLAKKMWNEEMTKKAKK